MSVDGFTFNSFGMESIKITVSDALLETDIARENRFSPKVKSSIFRGYPLPWKIPL